MFKHYSFSARERNRLFVNARGQHFVEAGYPLGIDADLEGRGVAVADFDQDGGLDLLVRSVARQKVIYFRNQVKPQANFLRLELAGRASHRDAIGATVRLRAGDHEQMRAKQAGNGFQGQSESTLHFGLGTVDRVDTLKVRWPSGREECFHDLPVNHLVHLVEGEGRVRLSRPLGWRPREEATTRSPVDWQAKTLDGEIYRPTLGKPVLIAFWASWCQPCHAEVAHLNALRQRFGDKLEIVGLTLEDSAIKARDFASRTTPAYPLIIARAEEVSPLLELAFGDGALPLPSSVLIDAQGQIRRVFGALSPGLIEQQIDRLLER